MWNQFDKLAGEYPETANSVWENACDSGMNPAAPETAAYCLRQLAGMIDAGEAR